MLVHAGSARVWVDGREHGSAPGRWGCCCRGIASASSSTAAWPHGTRGCRPARRSCAHAVRRRCRRRCRSRRRSTTLVREAVTLPTWRRAARHLALARALALRGRGLAGAPGDAPRPVDAAPALHPRPSRRCDARRSTRSRARARHARAPRPQLPAPPFGAHADRLPVGAPRRARPPTCSASTGLPLLVVAQRCGFKTEQHFSRRCARLRACRRPPSGARGGPAAGAGSGR